MFIEKYNSGYNSGYPDRYLAPDAPNDFWTQCYSGSEAERDKKIKAECHAGKGGRKATYSGKWFDCGDWKFQGQCAKPWWRNDRWKEDQCTGANKRQMSRQVSVGGFAFRNLHGGTDGHKLAAGGSRDWERACDYLPNPKSGKANGKEILKTIRKCVKTAGNEFWREVEVKDSSCGGEWKYPWETECHPEKTPNRRYIRWVDTKGIPDWKDVCLKMPESELPNGKMAKPQRCEENLGRHYAIYEENDPTCTEKETAFGGGVKKGFGDVGGAFGGAFGGLFSGLGGDTLKYIVYGGIAFVLLIMGLIIKLIIGAASSE